MGSNVNLSMNRSLFLHVVERLEGLVGRLPATIQKPILSELTPLKELFLKQRAPRFVFAGSANTPLSSVVRAMFPEFTPGELGVASHRKDRWRDYNFEDHGTISILDAREVAAASSIPEELDASPADVIFFIEDEDRKRVRKEPLENLSEIAARNQRAGSDASVIGIIFEAGERNLNGGGNGSELSDRASRLQKALESALKGDTPVLRILAVQEGMQSDSSEAVVSAIAQRLPNDARIEMARVFRHKQTQNEIAQLLVKSTTAICNAIGAQPIPLADLPILTTLQLVMVSGVMYVSGRERSLRAATEFVAALGANVGAGMLLREGARAILKFVPGWGNVICGMIAGAGTYAIGRAAIAYFLEGVSLKDARRTYLRSRKRSRAELAMGAEKPAKARVIERPKRTSRLRLRR